MSLLDESMVDCVIVNKTKIPDGEGGFINSWQEGEIFKAAIVMDTTMQARIADKQGVTSVYTITTRKNIELDYHDIVKRVKDGKYFRVTSDKNDKQSPKSATLNMSQVSAEKWELTT